MLLCISLFLFIYTYEYICVYDLFKYKYILAAPFTNKYQNPDSSLFNLVSRTLPCLACSYHSEETWRILWDFSTYQVSIIVKQNISYNPAFLPSTRKIYIIWLFYFIFIPLLADISLSNLTKMLFHIELNSL